MQNSKNLNTLFNIISSKNSVHGIKLKNHLDALTDRDIEKASFYIDNFLSLTKLNEKKIEFLADCYLGFVAETIREQISFLRSGRYSKSTFIEAKESIYDSDGKMLSYMLGLSVSLFLWKNHLEILNFYSEILDNITCKNYLEIGPGHGVFSGEAFRFLKPDSLTLVDISKTSLELSSRLLQRISRDKPLSVNTFCEDFFNFSSETVYDFIVAGEVLEHVEDPKEMLVKIRSMLSQNGNCFVSTCANAPAVDHIFLFSNIEEIREVIQDGGFTIKREYYSTADNISLEMANKKKAPINYCAHLIAN